MRRYTPLHRMNMTQMAILLCFAVLVGVPLLVRPGETVRRRVGDQLLIIVTPHNEQIRYEFKRAFEDWHWREHGSPVTVVYNVPGGTSEIRKLLESQFKSALENGTMLGGQADLVFGGGSFEHDQFKKPMTVEVNGEARRTTIAVPVEFEQAWLDATYGPNEIGGKTGTLYDPERHWFGIALSGFGIVFNRDALQQLGVDEPTMWSDLCDPRLEGWVALVNPSQSGSVKTAFESILHREGWAQGWRILRRASGNARYFSASSLKPPIDVSQGNAAMGVAIDFYGRFQSQAMKEAGDADRIGYVDPIGGSTIDADPITMLRGAPQPELAKKFIEFSLSDEGQALWQFRKNEGRQSGNAGGLGPTRFELRRMIITRSMYERHFPDFIDQVNPYVIATPAEYPDGNARDFISPVFAAMAMDTHHELREAWKAITAHPAYPKDGSIVTAEQVSDPGLREMLMLFNAMPSLPGPGPGGELSLSDGTHLGALRLGWVEGEWKELGFWSAKETPTDAMRKRFGAFFRANYRKIVELARQAPTSAM